MTNLEPRADKAVRDAVDAFMEGRLIADFTGETVFETKNSRYRLLDGVVFAAPDPSLVGAELVGWLCESQRRCLVESAWQPGSRAVLVDRKRGRNIIVTSTTRLLHLEEPGSGSYQSGSPKSHSNFRSWHPPPPERAPTPLPPLSARHAPIVASTPPPVPVSFTPPPPPMTPPPPPAPFASAATPLPAAAKRAAAVHPPPRPIGPRPSSSGMTPLPGATPLPAARPLPVPTPPPRRGSPLPPVAAAPAPFRMPAPPRVPPAGAWGASQWLATSRSDPPGQRPAEPPISTEPAGDWELTSAEVEVEPDTFEPATVERPDLNTVRHDALRHGAAAHVTEVPFELSRPLAVDGSDPVNAEPFPLVRAIEGMVSPGPPPRR